MALIERRSGSGHWKYHPQYITEEVSGLKVVSGCYTKRFGGLIDSVKMYIYPDGQILMEQSNATEQLKNTAWKESRKMLPTLTDKLISGDS